MLKGEDKMKICRRRNRTFKQRLNDLIPIAIRIANENHYGQLDKGGCPYILHPLAVMNLIKEEDLYFELSCKITAILHDVIEDTDVTKEYLLKEGIPLYIVEAVDLLSKKEGQSKNQYYKELKKNPIARVVKIADLTHNMDITRIKNPTEKDLKRVEIYKERYKELTK